LEVSSVAANLATSSEYEAEANRLRAQIGARVGALRSEFRPSSLATEAASRVGIADVSWGGAFDYASKRHPVPTAIIGLGLALWTMAAVRNRGRRDHLAIVAAPLRDSSDSIVQSATKVFRERAEAKRREFVDVAQSQVATGATLLSDEIGKKLETYIDRLPGGINVRPLIESSVQVALAAALEGLLRRRSRAG
jgi:hypothetical protein